jgi:hypothetical protein
MSRSTLPSSRRNGAVALDVHGTGDDGGDHSTHRRRGRPESYAISCALYGRRPVLVVADDSRDLTYGEYCRSLLTETRQRYGVEAL